MPNAYCSSLFNGTIDIETSLPLIALPIYHPFNSIEKLGVLEVINPKGIRPNLTGKLVKSSHINPFDLEIIEFFSQQLAQNILKTLEYQKIVENVEIDEEDNKEEKQIKFDPGLLNIPGSPKLPNFKKMKVSTSN